MLHVGKYKIQIFIKEFKMLDFYNCVKSHNALNIVAELNYFLNSPKTLNHTLMEQTKFMKCIKPLPKL